MRAVALLFLSVTVLASSLWAGDPVVSFTKSFPGSTPPYVEINVQKDGSAEYKEDPKDEAPLKFQLAPDNTARIFELADKLGHFGHPIESGLKVANMGAKSFRYSSGAETHSVTFNYSENEDAKLLLDFFEQISETERSLIELERTVKFDKLGVQAAILRIEASRDQKRLVAPDQFLPMLDRVAKNESYLHMARARAATLADSIRAPKPLPAAQ